MQARRETGTRSDDTAERRTHILSEVGWNVRRVGDEIHGEGLIIPELLAPKAKHLRTSMLIAWADQAMGLVVAGLMAPRVPATLELDVHLFTPAPGAGTVRGRARLVKAGRSVVSAAIEFADSDDATFAVGAGSFMLAGDPDVRLPSSLSLDRPMQVATLREPIAQRAGCDRRSAGVAELHRRPDGINSANTIHGGLLAVAAEEALLSLSEPHTLSSLALRYLRPARCGPIVAKASLRQGLGLVELRDAGSEERLVVTATARTFGSGNGG